MTIVAADRTDVLVAAGTITYADSTGVKLGEASSNGTGEMKLVRSTAIANAKQALDAEVESLTAALDFVPLANQKTKALRAGQAQGATLTANETAYLGRIRQVPSLMMLDLVPPPAPPPLAPPPAVEPVPPPLAAAPAPSPVPAKAPEPAKPIRVTVHNDGTIHYHGANLDMTTFQAKLSKIAAAHPAQAFVVQAPSDVPQDKVQAMVDALHAANFQDVTVKSLPPSAAPPAPAVPASAVAVTTPAPTPATDTEMPAPRMSAPTLDSSERIVPLEIDLHSRGKIVMEGEPVTFDQLKTKLAGVAAAIPNQTVVLRKDDQSSADDAKKVLAICRAFKLKATAVKVASATPVTGATPTATPPPPGLRMNPTMQISSDAPPATPAKPEAGASP